MQDVDKHTYAIIMAGGSGTRFWPLSRTSRPKQLLPLTGTDETLLQASVRRLQPIIPSERTFVVTSVRLADAVAEQLPSIPKHQILAEPVGRNTAPCIGWGASHIQRLDADAVIAVCPADQHVAHEASYVSCVRRALQAAADGHLVTIGIPPTQPETGYGYIECGKELEPALFSVSRFVEKPDRATAEHYLASGKFLWNSGMFFFKAEVIGSAIRTHLPALSNALDAYAKAAQQGNEAEVVARTYETLPNISIDHGIMEHMDTLAVIPGSFGWSDVGSFAAAWELAKKDALNNATQAQSVLIDTRGCYVKASPAKIVALVGLSDLIIVDTPDALLIMPRDRAQEVRKVVDQLQQPHHKRFV